jgi:heat-inducible transcriptional repressor
VSGLSQRQEYILGLIIREYVKAANPVGSKALVESYNLNVSSATVRNDMAALEDEGLIHAPHTSAGRVPTEAGYRYFVQKLLGDNELSPTEKRMIRHQFHQSQYDIEQWLRLAASVLAKTTRTASLVTSPQIVEARFKHLELICTQGRMVLMVLVLEGGAVRQQMLSLSEPVNQDKLSEAAAHINALCTGKQAGWIRSHFHQQPTLEQEIMGLTADLLDRAGIWHRAVYSDGLLNFFAPQYLSDRLDITPEQVKESSSEPVEADQLGARQALHILEEQSLLEEILADALTPDAEGVQVMIAGEGRWEELSHTSMVLSRYGHSQATGALGVLGPTRLHYGRAISAVRYVAGLMTDMLIEVYGEDDPFAGQS